MLPKLRGAWIASDNDVGRALPMSARIPVFAGIQREQRITVFSPWSPDGL